MISATGQKIIAELARMRMWRHVGDQGEAELCNDRINNLLDLTVAGATPLTMVACGEVKASCVDTKSIIF
jgi:hypothetical protein